MRRLASALFLFVALALVRGDSTTAAPLQSPPVQAAKPAAPPPSLDGTWPREMKTSVGTVTIYQPQVEEWDGIAIQYRSAVQVKATAEAPPTYGVVWGTTRTSVDKDTRLVSLHDRKFTMAVFPSAPDKQAAWMQVFEKEIQPAVKEIALDRLTAMLEVAAADKLAAAVPVKNDPPKILFSTLPSILVYVDGAPSYTPVKETKLERVVNTRVLLLRKGKEHFIKVFDGWLAAESLDGPWKVEKENGDLKKALADAKASGQVDFLPGGNPNDAKTLPSLKSGKVPLVFVATTPTELVVTEGEPQYEAIPGTSLAYVKNTTGNMFKDGDQKLYLLVSGRWFRAASMAGPWEHVASGALPADFAKIPDDNEKENVKAAVAGTAQAKEALIANAIPQTAEVKIKETKIDPPKFDGEVKLAPIEGTSLQYVVNTATPIIRVTDSSWYAIQDAVWFTGPAAGGPWSVATSVPPVIYTIPASSSLHYVTYVKIYETKPDVVYVGYTPGYYGSCVSHGTVVYGTGYYYPPYVGTTVWYGPPATYGVGVGMTYTPWTGWTFGFGFGWSWGAVTVGWGWGAYPWWGPVGWGYYYPYPYYRPPYWGGGAAWGPWGGGAVWGPGGWAATTGNVYSRWGANSAVTRRSGGYNAWTGDAWRNSAGMSYNSRTGNLSAGQRSAVGNVYSGNYAYGARGGSANTRGGGSVSGGRVTAGNVYTGNQATAGRISGTTGSGEHGSAAWARGEQGGVARVGDDVYAGHDGNVYKRNGDGGWDQHTPSGGWDRAQNTGSLDAQARARDSGATRTQGYDHARTSGYGSGYRGGGGYGGGGMRGGMGGRRR
jgi:hypothetical protein